MIAKRQTLWHDPADMFPGLNMSDFILNFLGSAVVSAVLSSFVVWLSRAWISERLKNAIKHEYDEKLESHKAQLKAQADVETERLRAQLSMAANEHQIRFSGLQSERAKVIAKANRLLIRAYWATASFVSPAEWQGEPNKPEKYRIAMESLTKFNRYFELHRIYLPNEICAQIDAFFKELRAKAIGFGIYVNRNEYSGGEDSINRKHDAWEKAWDYIEKEVPIARAALEKELRALLGDSAAT